MLNSFKQWVQKGVVTTLPVTCVVCALPVQGRRLGVCPQCWHDLPRLKKEEEAALTHTIKAAWFDDFHAPFVYEEPLPMLISRAKFHDTPQLMQAFVPFIKSVMPSNHENMLLVPVPLHPQRLMTRQYNQAALLAGYVARDMPDIEMRTDVLKRVKATRHQTGQTAAGRKREMRGAFKAATNVADKHIILVDDVMTTGSTVNACAKALKDAGAARVDVITIAWVRP